MNKSFGMLKIIIEKIKKTVNTHFLTCSTFRNIMLIPYFSLAYVTQWMMLVTSWRRSLFEELKSAQLSW
uniref:Uncharacterized protein n=1 Tax=Arion vulgaris TaxID=1028688 RepID=A0A0B7BH91_9EUPU